MGAVNPILLNCIEIGVVSVQIFSSVMDYLPAIESRVRFTSWMIVKCTD